MKFAKVLERTLIEDDIPESWVQAAIQYKALKKCINRVVDELNFLGLEQSTLKLLLDDTGEAVEMDSAANPSNPVIAHYVIKKSSSSISSTLKVFIDKNKDYTDDHMDSLIIELKNKMENIFNHDTSEEERIIEIKDHEMVISPTSSHNHARSISIDDDDSITKDENRYAISIKLNSDGKFFQMLETELSNLDKFKQREENAIIKQVEALSDIIERMSHRESLKKSDLYKWRELFRIYLDSEVYFKYNQVSKGTALTAEKVHANLDLFKTRVEQSGIVPTFKNKHSEQTFHQFIDVNYQLLKVLKFQSINTEAFRKILKKFDKQTSLGIKHSFPKLISNDHIFMNGSSVAQSICYILQDSVISIIPQLDDYTCPICLSIAYKPIRLECGHLFCVRCLVKMKKENKNDCPLCRYQEAIAKASGANLEVETMALMEKFFPIEVKEKLKERSKEKYDETIGNNKCTIM